MGQWAVGKVAGWAATQMAAEGDSTTLSARRGYQVRHPLPPSQLAQKGDREQSESR
jgi:hypothetical protein